MPVGPCPTSKTLESNTFTLISCSMLIFTQFLLFYQRDLLSLALQRYFIIKRNVAQSNVQIVNFLELTGEPGGLPSMGSHWVRHDWSDAAAAAAVCRAHKRYVSYYCVSLKFLKYPMVPLWICPLAHSLRTMAPWPRGTPCHLVPKCVP